MEANNFPLNADFQKLHNFFCFVWNKVMKLNLVHTSQFTLLMLQDNWTGKVM